MAILGTLALRLIIPVLLLRLPRLPCFKFTKEPQSPIIVVLDHNTTNVNMEWKFDAEGSTIASWKVKRFLINKDSSLSKETDLVYFSTSIKLWNRTLYTVDSSFATPGYANFTIKDVLKRADNADQTQVSSLSSDVYVYRLDVNTAPPSSMNIVTKKSNDVELQVYFLPESTSISVSPNQTSFCRGSLATISCTTYAKPPANYSLYHNTKLIHDNSTSGVFSVTLNDIGNNNYTCVPYNTVGFGQNRSVELLVKEPPKAENCKVVSNNATNGSVVEGDRVTLLCNDITGSDPLNIRWTNGRHLWNRVNLTFDSVNRENTGYYHVTVNNGKECNETKGENLTLDVYYKPDKPVISHSPNKTTFCLGSFINITCTSNANPPVEKYSLYRNEEWVQENNAGSFRVLLNKTGSINRFTCVPENQIGVGENKSLTTIHVIEPPGISHCYVSENGKERTFAVEGRNVTLRCDISGSEPLNITWTNGKYVWHDNTVTFEPVNRRDTGTYNLTVSNGKECNKAETSFELDVYYIPESTIIKIYPNKTAFCRGDQIHVNCTASAKPQAKYSLYQNDELSSSSKSGHFVVDLNMSGNITFTCVPSNEAGYGENSSVTLEVKAPPGIGRCQILENGKERTFAVEERNVILRCNISGSEPLDKTWTNGQQVWNDNTVTFEPVNRRDTGTYNLTVSNGEECNKAETNFKLDVYYVPEFTIIKIYPNKITFCRGDQIHVNCSASAKPQANYSLYQNDELVSSSRSGHFVVDLSTSGNISFTCVPSNEAGYGENSSVTREVKASPGIGRCQILENGKEKAFAVEGRNVILRCNISGSEPLNKTWTYGQQVWYGNTVTFEPVSRSDTGTYNLTVSNREECNNAETSFKLDVYYIPESTIMEIYPNNTTFCRGDQIHVNCTASAKPLANYSLYQNNELMRSNRIGHFAVDLNMSGNVSFTCVPSNEAGYGENSSATREVKAPPGINDCQILENGNEKAYVVEGTKVELRCNISGSEPLNITWTNGQQVWHDNTVTFEPVNRRDTATYNLTVSNREECNIAETSFKLNVYYLNELLICDNETLGLIKGDNYSFYVHGYPEPNISCTTGDKPPKQSYYSNGNKVHNVNVSDKVELNCEIKNEAKNCSFTLWKEIPEKIINATLSITNRDFEIEEKDKLNETVTKILREICKKQPFCKDVIVVELLKGSVIVNFQLIVIGAAGDYLQPLKNAVIKNSGILNGLNIKLDSIHSRFFGPTIRPATEINTSRPSTEPSTTSTPNETMIIVIVVVVVVVFLICITVVIVCYRKKKRQKDRENCVVVEEVVAVTADRNEEIGARDNGGFSPSEYAHHGPSHIDPAYDSVETRKGAKDKNDNQTQSGGEKVEPTYAAVDKTKKNKRKKPDEVTYAALGDFQPPGGRGGIVLEPLPKGQHTKMPEKYEETIYSTIIGTKKPASGNESAAGASDNIPLSDMHGQGTETESKPSDQTADPAKQNDQKPATDGKEKPPDNQGQPPTKEDSGCDARQVYN